MGVAFALVIGLVVGFFLGLLTFRQKQRWCTECGATLSCAECRASGPGSEMEPPPPDAPPEVVDAWRNRARVGQRRPSDEAQRASRVGRWWRDTP